MSQRRGRAAAERDRTGDFLPRRRKLAAGRQRRELRYQAAGNAGDRRRESGSGKSITALSLMGLVPTVNRRVEGMALFDGRDLSSSRSRRCDVRGNEIAMIFQEPMTSLNPVATIGAQIAEALYYHRGLDWRSAKIEALRMLDLVRIPDRAGAWRIIASILRRNASARHDRDGAGVPAEAADCRRADHRARRDGAGGNFAADAGAAARAGACAAAITHDMGVVAEIADRVLVMWRGNKVEEAPVAGIFAPARELHPRADRCGATAGRDARRGGAAAFRRDRSGRWRASSVARRFTGAARARRCSRSSGSPHVTDLERHSASCHRARARGRRCLFLVAPG